MTNCSVSPSLLLDALCEEMEDPNLQRELDEILEKTIFGFRLWAILYGAFALISLVVVLLCCCVRFRIPRTKQEIEADYVRRQITQHFQKYLKTIEDAEMDEMDLQKALIRVKGVFDAEHQPSPADSSQTEEFCAEDHHGSRRDKETKLHLRKLEQKKTHFKLSNVIKSFNMFPTKRQSKPDLSAKPRELQV